MSQGNTKTNFRVDSDWKPLAEKYHAYHFKCPTCISAGQGRGTRCAAGAQLWVKYQGAK